MPAHTSLRREMKAPTYKACGKLNSPMATVRGSLVVLLQDERSMTEGPKLLTKTPELFSPVRIGLQFHLSRTNAAGEHRLESRCRGLDGADGLGMREEQA